MLVDVVSKNGNLLLSVPLQKGGQPDANEPEKNRFGDRRLVESQWRGHLRNPALESIRRRAFYPHNRTGSIRWQATFKKRPSRRRYPIHASQRRQANLCVDAWVPDGPLKIVSFARDTGKVTSVSMVGSREKMRWTQNDSGLEIQPAKKWPSQFAVSFRIKLEH